GEAAAVNVYEQAIAVFGPNVLRRDDIGLHAANRGGLDLHLELLAQRWQSLHRRRFDRADLVLPALRRRGEDVPDPRIGQGDELLDLGARRLRDGERVSTG